MSRSTQILGWGIVLLFLSIGAPSTASAAGPSFNCARASAPDEIAICASDELSELDNLMAAGFQYLKLQQGRKQANQMALPLLHLRQACGSDQACIRQRQIDAITAYQKLGAPIRLPDSTSTSSAAASNTDEDEDGMPKTIGACSDSKIDWIGGRLEGDENFETGTSVGYVNGGSQVTYDREEGIVASKIGDPVRICLVELPKDCPPDDDRGKVYHTTNLRTGAEWELADSQHMCGGA